ncbi:MAG: hypothetical protein ACRDI1_10450 [Actinomycetota bacterium]
MNVFRSKGAIGIWRRVAILAALTTLPACSFGRGAGPRVGMETDQTDILFGVPELEEVEAARQEAEAQTRAAQEEPAEEEFAQFRGEFSGFGSVPPASCPSAPAGAPVSENSPTDVKDKPRDGAYRWVSSGTYGIPQAPDTKIPLTPFHAQFVTPARDFPEQVEPPPGSPPSMNFTYRTLEPRVDGGGLLQFSWQVKTNSSVSQDPEAGMTLKRVDIVGDDGRVQSNRFVPAGVGLLMAPLPIRPGISWNSVSVDASRGNFRLSGQVRAREVVDACGTLVQGWHVHATFTQNVAAATLDYLVATQDGGQMISKEIDGSFFGTIFNPATFHVGQTSPDPLPERLR